MTTLAKPETNDPKIGSSSPAESLWESSKTVIGPPEAGQPRKGAANPGAPASSVITGDEPEPSTEK